MSKSIEQILGASNLTGVIQKVEGGIPVLLPPELLTPSEDVEGDFHRMSVFESTRRNAKIVTYGAPAVERDAESIGEIAFKLIHSFESKRIKPTTLMNLLAEDGSGKQNKGLQTIARGTADLKQLMLNLRWSSIYSLLSQGQIAWASDGEILDPATASPFQTVNFNVPDGNKDQLDVFGTGDIIDVSWDDVAADIETHVQCIDEASLKLTGRPIKHAFHGKNILKFLLKNDRTKELINMTSNQT